MNPILNRLIEQNILNQDQTAVEWKPLGEVAKIEKGSQLNKSLLSEIGDYPVINGGINPSGYWHEYNHEAYTTVISQGGASAGFVNWMTTPFFAGAHAFVVLPNEAKILKRYAYHFLKMNQTGFMERQYGAGIPALAKSDLTNLQIPIPPLEAQREIVRVLDNFTELTAELTARKKQYGYYRNRLLTFDDRNPFSDGHSVVWKTLGEIGEVRMCKRILKNQTSSSGEIPFYKIGTFGKEPNAFITRELFENYKEKYNYPKKGEILLSASGTIGRTVIFDGEDAYFQDSNIVWIENNEKQISNKFLFYLYQAAKWDIAEGGTIQRLYNDNLKKLKIPIPSLETQAKIVTVLDQFDTLTHSISEGLPREIELRQKQYEYYREKLLNFEAA